MANNNMLVINFARPKTVNLKNELIQILLFSCSIFACDSIYAIAHICYRPSVCLSITWVDQSKTLEVRIMQLSPPGSPMTLVSSWLISPRNSKGNIGSEGAK